MPPKRLIRKSRMDLMLEKMDAVAPSANGKRLITAEELLALSSSSSSSDSEENVDCEPFSPSSPTEEISSPTCGGDGNPRRAQRGRRIERQESTLSESQDALASGSSSPLFLSEMGIRQRKKDMEIANILFEADAVGVSKDAHSLHTLISLLCGSAPEGRDGEEDPERGLFSEDDATTKPALSVGYLAAEANQTLSMLRTMGTSMNSLVSSLTTKPFYSRPGKTSPTIAKAHLQLIRFVFLQCATETMARPSVFQFLIDFLRASLGVGEGNSPLCPSSPTVAAPPQAKPARVSHWSALIKNTAKAVGQQQPSAATVASAEDDAKAINAVRAILSEEQFEQVRSTQVGVEALVSELLAFVLVASNRQSLFGAHGSAEASSGGISGSFIESQNSSDMVDVFGILNDEDATGGLECGDAFTSRRNGCGSGASASLVFHDLGGFDACLFALRKNTKTLSLASSPADINTLVKVLSLLEVATCTDSLKNKDHSNAVKGVLGKILLEVFSLLNAFATSTQSEKGSADVSPTQKNVKEILLRVATNITGVCSDAIPTDVANAGKCAQLLSKMLEAKSKHDGASAPFDFQRVVHNLDSIGEVVCLAINFAKRGNNDTFRWALLDTMGEGFADWCVGWLQALYSEEDRSANVLAGYIALLLAMLSLGDEEARVMIVTALSTHAAASVQSVSSKPLAWVVAVLQEFVLFQSAAQILTKEMVVAMHTVVERVIKENNISVCNIE